MSKKKNTLKDLDEFLKQQAASLVSPEKLSVKQDVIETPAPEVKPAEIDPSNQDLHARLLTELASSGSRVDTLCNLILEAFSGVTHTTPEEKMLINTALYLKHPEDWKNVIREYWRKHT